jgi:hypothetical protein
MMKITRLLLPFVHGVDKFAIEQAILLAKSHQATLVPLVLIYVPEERRTKGARLEHVQQSMDFLGTVKQKSDWYAVPVECLEVFTCHVVQSINLVASEMECEGILLFEGQKGGILLQAIEIKRLIEMPACKLYVTRLPTIEHVSFAQALRQRFSHRLHGRSERKGEPTRGQEYLEKEVELSLRA